MPHRHASGSTRRLTPAADRGDDSAEVVADLRQMVVTPHVARKKNEEPFGWVKTVGGMAQTLYRGIARVRFTLAMAACNLARLPKLLSA